jgi:C1q domain
MTQLTVTIKDKVANDLNEPDIGTAFRQIEQWAKEPVNALVQPPRIRYYRSLGFSTSTSTTTFIFDALAWDNTANAYDNATGKFTCPYSGYYGVQSIVGASSSAAGQYIGLQIMHNATIDATTGTITPSAGLALWTQIQSEVLCISGDTLYLDWYSSTTGLTGGTGYAHTFLIIEYRGQQ